MISPSPVCWYVNCAISSAENSPCSVTKTSSSSSKPLVPWPGVRPPCCPVSPVSEPVLPCSSSDSDRLMPVVTPSPAHPPSMKPICVSMTCIGQLLVSLPLVTGWAGGVFRLTTGGGAASALSLTGWLCQYWTLAQPWPSGQSLRFPEPAG